MISFLPLFSCFWFLSFPYIPPLLWSKYYNSCLWGTNHMLAVFLASIPAFLPFKLLRPFPEALELLYIVWFHYFPS